MSHFRALDWNAVITTIGSTTAVVAILSFLAQTIIKHVLNRDVETHKADLKWEADRELANMKARADTALLEQKADFDREMEALKSELATRSARVERLREEVIHWANPILGSVMSLQRRLDVILKEEGYLALSPPIVEGHIKINWSATYEYYIISSVFYFLRSISVGFVYLRSD
jgi:hypothetical protein